MHQSGELISEQFAKQPVLSKPVLFLHIPKTAGTSFLLMLQNTFGDRRVLRIRTIDENIQQLIDDIVSAELDQISCLTGHLPIHLLSHHLDKFQVFTILRDPIDRVTSLFRFLKLKPANELARLGLQPDFSFEDFLDSRHPELHSQTNNGMVRMLCGDARVFDADDTGSDPDGVCRPLELAARNLEHMDFGLTEEMGPTLDLVQALWRIPFSLSEYRENRTAKDVAGYDVQTIHQIVSRNTLDLALYNKARELYFSRRTEMRRATASDGWNPLAVFLPPLSTDVLVGDIPGRKGFYEFEDIGLSWLQENQPAELYFASARGTRKMTLHVHSLYADYPVSATSIWINGTAIPFEISQGGPRWHWLRTSQFEVQDGINKLEIVAPLFVAVKSVYPDTEDARSLGLAVSHINLSE